MSFVEKPPRRGRPIRPVPMAAAPPLIELADGQLFDPLRPDPESLDIRLIAVGLANLCRFGGQVEDFYSVAQHSVLVALLSPQDMPAQRMALLHDAEEAFGLPDMPSPLKPHFPDYVGAQGRIAEAVYARFRLDPADHARIKPADRQALVTEKARFKSFSNLDYWNRWSFDFDPAPGLVIDPLGPKEARGLFLAAHERIFLQDLPVTRDWLQDQPGFALEDALTPGF